MLSVPNMPRAVLDSSVLVSAFLTPHGSVVRLLREPVRSRYELSPSEAIREGEEEFARGETHRLDDALAAGLADIRAGRVSPSFKSMREFEAWLKTEEGQKFEKE